MHSTMMRNPVSLFGAEGGWLAGHALESEKAYSEPGSRPTAAKSLLLQSTAGKIQETVTCLGRWVTELQKLAGHRSAGRYGLAQATMEYYVPLADRLGLSSLATQLQDACFAILLPAEYRRLLRSLKPTLVEDAVHLEILRYEVQDLLQCHSIVCMMQSRVKGLYSLYRKMTCLDSCPDDIRDRVGIRIIVRSIDDCYQVMGLIHTRFAYIPGTFDDYIGAPKANGYQSLHTCISAIDHRPAEIQIRTLQMHMEAEFGNAAHWQYKQSDGAGCSQQRRLPRRLSRAAQR